MDTPKKESTRVDFLLSFFQNNKFTAVVIVLCLALIGLSKVTESGDQLLRMCGIIKKYDIDQITDRGRFSSELTKTAWNRLFWMRNYTERVRRKASAEDLAASWQKLMDATEKWNTDVMNYYIGLDTYYPKSGKRNELENHIQPAISSAMTLIVDLRYDLPKLSNDTAGIGSRIKQIQNSIEDINIQLYQFIDQPSPAKKQLPN